MHSFSSKMLIGSLLWFTAYGFSEEPCAKEINHYRMSVRHIESGGIGYNQGYTTLEAFLAPDPSTLAIMPFIDVRGHVFNDGKFAANTGIGIRGLKGCRVYGGNVYYDYRNTKHDHYNQIGLGFETLGVRWDFRANGYIPVGSKKSSDYDIKTTSISVFDGFQGNQALIKHTLTSKSKVQFAMTGFNTEAAFHILKNEHVDLYAAAGPYYYNYSSKQAVGGQARLGAKVYEYFTVEAINSYDSRFHEHIQGSLGINIPLGPKFGFSKNKKLKKCSSPCLLAQRFVQDVERQEIIVVDKIQKTSISETISPAINPLTGTPYFFVFVDNTSNSLGTYESPYPTLALAAENSSPGDILYIFPGDGTATGMNSGITLQTKQKFWGSGISHLLQTSLGTISLPAQTSLNPTISNVDFYTEGNTITLASDNAISGFTISSSIADAIYGVDVQNLDVSFCTIENTGTFTIETHSPNDAIISVTNNQFLDNANGTAFFLNGTSTVTCSNNTFERQTSTSERPIEIIASNNSVTTHIENNIFHENITGSIIVNLQDVEQIDINLLNNTFTNNTTGSVATLGSNVVILPSGNTSNCSLIAENNTFSGNESCSIYLHTSGSFTNLEITTSANTMSNNGGSALVIATPSENLTLLATNNTVSGTHDNAISIISGSATTTGKLTINNNTLSEIGNSSSGVAIAQDFENLDLTVINNTINNCEGTGIFCYTSTINSLTAIITDNKISNCQNLGFNAASGISLDGYISFDLTIENNNFSNNATPSVAVGLYTSGNPDGCLTLSGNSCNVDPSYSFTNPGSGTVNLSPCNVDSVNTGELDTFGTVNFVRSCSDTTLCY